MNPSAALVIVLAIAAVGLLVWLVFFLQKRRRDRWKEVALALDLAYQKEDRPLALRFGAFKIFNQGHSRRARNVLTGRRGNIQVTLTDYRFVTGHGQHQQVHSQTLCILQSPELALPHCFLRRQHRVIDFLGKLFGGKDINYDEDPEFSRTFVLQGRDEAATRALFGPDARAYFLRFQGTSVHFEGLGDTLVLHFGKNIKPATARDLLEQTLGLLNLFHNRR